MTSQLMENGFSIVVERVITANPQKHKQHITNVTNALYLCDYSEYIRMLG